MDTELGFEIFLWVEGGVCNHPKHQSVSKRDADGSRLIGRTPSILESGLRISYSAHVCQEKSYLNKTTHGWQDRVTSHGDNLT